MPPLTELHNSASGPCLIMGNGPGLNDVPHTFLEESYPTFACNFFTLYKPHLNIDHLAMIDRGTVQEPNAWMYVREHTKVFVFDKWWEHIPPDVSRDNVYPWANRDDLIEGFTFGDIHGQYFPTTGHACVWLADYIGYDRFYLVGMDGTAQLRELSGVNEWGETEVPHFYGKEQPGRFSMMWDVAWGNMYRHMYHKRGKKIINLSTQTQITQLPRQDLYEHIEADPHRRLWPEYKPSS